MGGRQGKICQKILKVRVWPKFAVFSAGLFVECVPTCEGFCEEVFLAHGDNFTITCYFRKEILRNHYIFNNCDSYCSLSAITLNKID